MQARKKNLQSFWLQQPLCSLCLLLFQRDPLPIAESRKLTVRIRASRGFVFLFLECGGETVKGVRKVSESVSTEPVVFFSTRCTTRFPASHCLLLTPFRYCSYLLPPLFSFSLTISLSLFQLLSLLIQISPCFSSI